MGLEGSREGCGPIAPKVTRDECKAHQKDQQKAVGMADEDLSDLETSTEFLALIGYPV